MRTEQDPERLHPREIKRRYPRRKFVAGWRIRTRFSDGNDRFIDIVVTNFFPNSSVRTALVDPPPFLTWPHVEDDGILCLLPNMAECDPDDPIAVAENILNRSMRLIEDLIEGLIVDRDFREEFLTYWWYKSVKDGLRLHSILKPAPPSRVVQLWTNSALEIVGEDNSSLSQWVRNRFGSEVDTTTEKSAFIWLSTPPLPAKYPEMASDFV